jgi:hypothetical protein
MKLTMRDLDDLLLLLLLLLLLAAVGTYLI